MRQPFFEISGREPIASLNERENLEAVQRPQDPSAFRPTEQSLVIEGLMVAGYYAVKMPAGVTMSAYVVIHRFLEVRGVLGPGKIEVPGILRSPLARPRALPYAVSMLLCYCSRGP